MATWDLIVIGAGAVGAAALRAAAESGARVLGLEQFTPANERGSSHGRSRIFRHAYFEHPDYVPLLRHSTARFRSLEQASGAPLLHGCGMLIIGRPGSTYVDGSLESGRRWSIPIEALDAADLRARFPWFTIADDAVGAFEADAGIVRPERAIVASVEVAERRGAQLRLATRVRRISEDANGVDVQTDDGTERGAAVIVAAGAWTAGLLPELAPILTVTRQVQAWIEPSPGVDATAMPCWLVDRGAHRRPIYGLAPDPLDASPRPKAGLHGSTDRVDPDRGAAPVATRDTDRLLEAYHGVAPALAGRVVRATTCLYTMSPDSHFLVGTRRGGRRTHFAAGLSGHGFKLGPALGDALVQLALHGRTDLPIGFLSPERATCTTA